MSTEVTIGSKLYYKKDEIWHNESGEEATRFEIIKIKSVTAIMVLMGLGFVSIIVVAALGQNQGRNSHHNTNNSISFHYGTPEEVAINKCESYSFFEYADPNIVMSCSPRTDIVSAPDLRVISEPEMFEVTLSTAAYYLEQGLIINDNCLAHDFIGEGGDVKYDPIDTCGER